LEEVLPEGADENLVSFRYQDFWETMSTIHVVQKCLSHCLSCEWMLEGYEMAILRKLVHNHQYGVEFVGFRQSFDEV
jgi:hypothetical protein